jgi:phospholipid/cholesterol/gamma-HCH transport system ATP-binding protein
MKPAEVPVELFGVKKSFGNHPVLRGVDLSARARETLVIIGRSGSGKSVTLRHIVGIEDQDSGRVKVFGTDLKTASKAQLHEIRSRIGFLFQSGALLNWMNIEENVALPLIEHDRKIPPEQVEKRVLQKLRLVGMESARKKLPSEISGGMKKRAALARATILDPDLVLYDEPTSGLDPVIANTINDLINRTKQALGTTQIVVTHDMESAYRIADRIAMLYEGQIVALGTPGEIQTSTNPVVKQFINGQTDGPLALDS